MKRDDPPTRLYTELAPWWPLLSAPADYAEEAAVYRDLLAMACAPRTVLELGSGGGNNASHLKASFELTLVDRSSEMLEVSRVLNPECEHLEGDMRDVRLGRLFDAVFVHDAVVYLTSEDELRRAIETAYVHCRPGGAALFVPDDFRETFVDGVGIGGHDGGGDDRRSLRYLEWSFDPDPDDDVYEVDFAIFLRREGEPPRLLHDRHRCGFFARGRWLELATEVGFRAEIVTVPPLEDGEVLNLVLCRKPEDGSA